MKDLEYVNNVKQLAYETFFAMYRTAKKSDFCSTKIDGLIPILKKNVTKTKNLKKQIKHYIAASSAIMKYEVIKEPNLMFTLNLLMCIVKYRLWTRDKLHKCILNIPVIFGMQFGLKSKILLKLTGRYN